MCRVLPIREGAYSRVEAGARQAAPPDGSDQPHASQNRGASEAVAWWRGVRDRAWNVVP